MPRLELERDVKGLDPGLRIPLPPLLLLLLLSMSTSLFMPRLELEREVKGLDPGLRIPLLLLSMFISLPMNLSKSETGGAEFCGGRSWEPLFFDVDMKQHAIALWGGVWLEAAGVEVTAAAGRSSRPAPRKGRALPHLPAAFAL